MKTKQHEPINIINQRFIVLSLILCLIPLFLNSCGSTSDTTSDTTSIVFSVEWKGTPVMSSTSLQKQKAENEEISTIKNKIDCASSGVATVEANVYDNAETHLAKGGPWHCNDHSGKIIGSMAGTNRKIAFIGKNSNGTVLYWGEVAGKAIAKGQTTDIGTIIISPINVPIANASPDQIVSTGFALTLYGSGSSYADGDPLTYAWSITSLPNGSAASLSNSTTINPTFTPDVDGDYVISLVVNDGIEDSAADTIIITASTNPPSYTDNGDGTVTDNVTALMWQQENDGANRTWANARTYCDGLVLASYFDWRLPTKKELISIVNYGTDSPSIDTTYFPNTNSLVYWSSTTYANDSSYAWAVYFGNGVGNYYGKWYSSYVRCVRGGQ